MVTTPMFDVTFVYFVSIKIQSTCGKIFAMLDMKAVATLYWPLSRFFPPLDVESGLRDLGQGQVA